MLRHILLFLSFIAIAAPTFACEMATAKRASQLMNYASNGLACLESPPGDFRFDPQMEQSFIEKINQERIKRGLKALKIRKDMRPAARFHSLDMGVNGFFGHKSPKGKNHVFRMSAFDRTLLTEGSAENVAQFGPAQCVDSTGQIIPCTMAPGFVLPTRDLVVGDLHKKLMESDGHRRNILSEDMTHVSLGVARTDTGFYVTQMFAKKAGDLSQPLPLQYRAGDAIEVTAEIPGWTVSNMALSTHAAPADLTSNIIPLATRGDLNLRIRAENVFTKSTNGGLSTITEWIYPTGPAVTVLPPKGS